MPDSTRPDIPENVNTVPAEDGPPWVEIASSGAEDEATLLAGFLEAAGISANIENVKFAMEPINFGTMGDIRIYVANEDESRAMELVRSRNVAYDKLDDDGETVVTDEGPASIDDNSTTERENDV